MVHAKPMWSYETIPYMRMHVYTCTTNRSFQWQSKQWVQLNDVQFFIFQQHRQLSHKVCWHTLRCTIRIKITNTHFEFFKFLKIFSRGTLNNRYDFYNRSVHWSDQQLSRLWNICLFPVQTMGWRELPSILCLLSGYECKQY